ncbi:MAG: MerR family transcriptional regulator [Planctomycetes bacterium]|nr:MerR family transcriptional regulator [Planctomycetota bacterium]
MSSELPLLKPRDLLERTGISRQLLQSLITMRLIEPAEVTETGRYLYDDQTVKSVKAYLRWRDLGYSRAEIRRMFQHRFHRKDS